MALSFTCRSRYSIVKTFQEPRKENMKLGILILFVIAFAAFTQAPNYTDFLYVYADGSRIDLANGYASPLVTDWDGDDDKDLLIGRF